MRTFSFETLEARRLLTGVTIVAPTWDSTLGTFLLGSANNLVNRVGGFTNCPWYTLVIGVNSTTNRLQVTGLNHDPRSATNLNSPSDQIIFIVDYTGGANNYISTNPSYPLTETAALVSNYMENNTVDGIDLASVPIHLMGVSRSAVLMDDIAQNLGQSGIWVDYETYMDPHPVYSIGDPQNALYDNVAFADDYWRTSGQPEVAPYYNGTAVAGAYNQELPYVQAQNGGYNTPHVAPAGYYNATIDLNSTQEFGPGYGSPVYDSWWGTTAAQPPRNATGFYYSDYVGGSRPLSGVWAQGGGSGARIATVASGVQWPNVTGLSMAGTNTFSSGQVISLSYLHEDRGASSHITFSLDTDQNPINNNFAATVGSADFAASTSAATDHSTLSTAGVSPGTYYLCAAITDGQGHTRYAYTQAITITKVAVQVANAAAASSPVVTTNSTNLSILGGGPVAESNMIYTWTAVRFPPGAPNPIFSANGTNAAKNLSVKLGKDGSYRFRCTITDSADSSLPPATSDVSVVVQQVATSLRVSPHGAKVGRHKKIRFTTTVLDQFNHPMRNAPVTQYAIASGPGSIGPSSGTFKASSKAGRVDVDVKADQLSAMLRLLVVM